MVWSVANEPESVTDASRAYFAPLVAEVRRLDPTRPVGFVNVLTVTPDVDVITDLFDVVMLNRYYGWYVEPGDLAAAERGLEAELEVWAQREGKPIIMTEYGGDTLEGLQASRRCPGRRNTKWTCSPCTTVSSTGSRPSLAISRLTSIGWYDCLKRLDAW